MAIRRPTRSERASVRVGCRSSPRRHAQAPTAPSEIVLMEQQPGIDVAGALKRLGGNRALLARLLAEFARSQVGTVDKIRACLAQGAVEDAMRHAHTLKGVAANLSAARL